MNTNPICEMLGIKYPVIQGGMAWIADAELASAVSNAGGLGLIAAMNSNGKQLKAQIRKAKELTDKTFGVNLMLMSPFIDEAVQVVCEEGVKVVTTGAGNPAKYMEQLKSAGVKVICVVASVALAVMVERMGASAIVAEGCESGGHVGDTTTMALVPQVVTRSISRSSQPAESPTEEAWLRHLCGRTGIADGNKVPDSQRV